MQIYVIQPGDSIFTISNAFGVTPNEIISINELDAPNNLVVGQTIVIPIVGQYYFVQPGDSLFTIANRFQLSVQQLAEINQISIYTPLQVGFRLYIPELPKREISSLAYVEPLGGTFSETLKNEARQRSPYLTYLALFSFRVNRDGTLDRPPTNSIQEIAATGNASPTLVVTNLEGDSFSTDLARIIVTDTAVQDTLLDEIVNTATEEGYRDVHFDFEFLPRDARENYNNFLRKAKARLSEAGLLMSTALAPKTSADQQGILYEAHDYRAHGEIADFVVLMTYEWGYSAGPAMPVSPLNEVERVIDYALTEIPAEKIMLGQNLYGYDWTLPFVAGESFARSLSPQQAIALAREVNAAISYDYTAQAPHFSYYDENGRQHVVWFEDARSIQAKFDLIKRKNLRGISYWKLGLSFPQNWVLLDNNFIITKL